MDIATPRTGPAETTPSQPDTLRGQDAVRGCTPPRQRRYDSPVGDDVLNVHASTG